MAIVQEAVYEAVKRRGFVEGWEPEEFVVRSVAKLGEELGELGEAVGMGELKEHFERLRLNCERALEVPDRWRGDFILDRQQAIAELADVQVLVFCIAQALGVDVETEAFNKAVADIHRREPEVSEEVF